MTESKFPAGWDVERARRLIASDAALSEDEQLAADEDALREHSGQTVLSVPDELVPAIRRLIAGHKVAGA